MTLAESNPFLDLGSGQLGKMTESYAVTRLWDLHNLIVMGVHVGRAQIVPNSSVVSIISDPRAADFNTI